MFVIQLLGVALSLVFTNTEGKGPFDLRQGLRRKYPYTSTIISNQKEEGPEARPFLFPIPSPNFDPVLIPI
jgi:hypothetical protein